MLNVLFRVEDSLEGSQEDSLLSGMEVQLLEILSSHQKEVVARLVKLEKRVVKLAGANMDKRPCRSLRRRSRLGSACRRNTPWPS